jgi:hypothetical protein
MGADDIDPKLENVERSANRRAVCSGFTRLTSSERIEGKKPPPRLSMTKEMMRKSGVGERPIRTNPTNKQTRQIRVMRRSFACEGK